MKRFLCTILMTTSFLVMPGAFVLFCPTHVLADSEPVGELVTRILAEESGGKIKVMVLDFRVAFTNMEKKTSAEELKNISSRVTDEFIADLMQKINNGGKQNRVAIIDSSRLNDILREKKMPVTAVEDRTATELGTIAGVDVVITGAVQVSDKASVTVVKTVRVKDGEIISIVKLEQGGSVKAGRGAFAPMTVIDKVEKIEIGTWKPLAVNLTNSGTLHVAIDVVHGNPIDVVLIAEPELERLKKNEPFISQPEFTAARAKRYQRKAAIEKGNYYLVLRDSSTGVFSVSQSDVKVNVRLEP